MSKKNNTTKKQNATVANNAENAKPNAEATQTVTSETKEPTDETEVPTETAQTDAEVKEKEEKKEKQPAEDPIIKARRTKEKQMCNNMHVFLRSKGYACDLIQLSEKKAPHYTVKGLFKDENEKEFRFIIRTVPECQNEKGNPQVEMLMELEDNKFATTHPQNNTHLEFLLKNFKTGISTIEEAEAIEPKEVEATA